MTDDFIIAPVKGINKAFENGIKLARGVARSASDVPAVQALRITESAKTLQKSLEKDGKAITESYRKGIADLGKPFSDALTEDSTNLRRLKDLRIDLLDQINDCPDFDDEPESFDPKPFNEIQKQSKICCIECLEIFDAVREQLTQTGTFSSNSDDRTQLSGMGTVPPTPIEQPPPPVPPKPVPILDTPAVEPPKPKSSWSLDMPLSNLDIGGVSPALSGTRPLSGEVSPLSEQPHLIPREIVNSRVSANNDFLERRRQSRLLWQDQIRQSSISSISEIPNNSPSPVNSSAVRSSITTVSPIDNPSRPSGIAFPPAMAREQSQNSQITRSSRTSSLLHDITERPRHDSTTSQESIFGLRSSAPLSPPQSEHRTSGPEWGALATTLRVPGFGNGVEDGLEVVSPVDHGNGLMLVSDENQIANQPTPATSIKSTDYPIRHDASFYKFGGFCDGARELLKGETGFKIVKRPSGHYSATISAKCIKCSYEVGYKDLEKDEKLDSAGIYGNCGIRWRQLFVSKCHVKTNSVEEPIYACIFCIEEHKTVEEHDATVFFSVTSLFRHLATHSLPLPTIKGIKTIYGMQPPTMVDFDVHFTNSLATPSQYCLSVIAPKVASRPAAYATATHHPKSKTSAFFDPAGNPTLHFAAGARILGITFPVQFKGDWCIGYHDGQRGSFPASAIMLETPRGEDVDMSPQSNLTAIAKWDFKPKDAKDGGWLRFSRGDKITNIGYTFQDQWCWSGQTSKGKWGLFPAAFVEGLREGPHTSSSSTSPGSARNGVLGGLSGRISGFGGPLRRSTGGISTSGKAERSASIRSNSSGSSLVGGRRPVLQPGLEVATSSSGSWRGS